MKNTKILLSLLLIGFLTTGCNNDTDKNNDDNTEEVLNSTKITISGVVVDGYISGAKVCLDLNRNNKCDETEPFTTTDKQGKYEISFDKLENPSYAKANIISIGGFDETAQMEFTNKLKAPFIENTKVININPLMDIISDKMNNENITFEEARKQIAGSFGLKEKNINSDILADSNGAAFKTALKIQKFKETLGFLNKTEKAEVIAELNNNIDGNKTTMSSIINNIHNPKLNNVKDEIIDTISSISVPDNSSYREKSIIQKRIEEKKKILNNLIAKYSANTLSFDNTNIVSSDEFKEVYNIQKQIITIIQEKGELIAEKLKLLDLSDMITNEEFYSLKYKDFLNINFNNIYNLDDLKYEISLTTLDDNIKEMFNDIIETKKIENNN